MKKRIQYFNIVEIALALAIVGIGVAGIMSLFPVALNASRDSVGDNNAPDVAEQFMAYTNGMLLSTAAPDWTSLINNIPDTTTRPDDSSASWDDSKTLGNITPSSNCITSGLYRVLQKSGDIADFSGVVWVRRAQIPNFYLEGQSATVPYILGLGLYVEVSWPMEKPYVQREKRIYYLEIFNPYAD